MASTPRSAPIRYTLELLLRLLGARGAITPAQAASITKQSKEIQGKLLRDRVEGMDKRRALRINVSPSEVIAHLEFEDPGGKRIHEDYIAQVVAEHVGLAFEKPDPLKLNAEFVTSVIQRAFARHHSCVALRREGGKVLIAVHDPFDTRLIEQLQMITQGEMQLVISARSDIQRIITEIYGFRSSITAAEQLHGTGINVGNLEQLTQLTNVENLEATDRPIVNAVEYLFHYAFDQRASDIHIEPKRERTIVRLRIDGMLHNVYSLPRTVHAPLVSRLKMMARMDIAEKRRPQGGRIKTARQGGEIELRVSSLPVAFGEKLVIRIFDPQSLIQDLEQVGFYKEELNLWRSFFQRPHGLVLVTGPTGSGKTTTLYSTLKQLAGPEVNITTIEDPIEMVYEEFNQVLVQTQIEMTFAAILRTILRQDPDIVMIGEIRDMETAKMAVQAAMTGHLVFSTLHTNDTASSITRLLDLGVEPFLLSSTLVGVMAQRLLRKVCKHCKTEVMLSSEQIDLLEIKLPPYAEQALPVTFGEGCLECRGTGYKGRTGVFELMEIDATLRRLIAHGASSPEIYKAARASNMMSLREHAIKKMAAGKTSFEEVMTVFSES